MKAVLVNYNYTPDWLSKYPELEPLIYDRSDDKESRDLQKYGAVYKTRNMGDVDHDKLSYLIENYYDLPEVFVWGKTNLFKYVDEAYFKEQLKKNIFAPLLKLNHKTYSDKWGEVCFYRDGMYYERADSWFFNNPALSRRYCTTWQDWVSHFGLPQQNYIPFAPGGNYILTK